MLPILLLICWQTAAQESVKPLPDATSFVQQIRKRLRSDRTLLSQYTYTEMLTARELDKAGNVKKTNLRVFEVYPSVDEELTFRRLISKDGKPLTEKELDKQDHEHTKKLEAHEHRLKNEGTDEKKRREAKAAEERRKEDEILDEAFQLYDITLVGRRFLDGLPTIEFAFQPRSQYRPKTREGRMLAKMGGHAWFGEEDYELIRIEVHLLDDIALGFGLLARLNKGANMTFQRRRVNNEIWLPAEARFSGTGRLLLFKGIRIDGSTEFSDYKKFTVETSVKYATDQK